MSEVRVEFLDWSPEKLKGAILDKLQQNAPAAAKYVEDDARRRLDGIRSPDNKRDNNYRRYLSKYMLSNVVERDGDSLVIAVGMKIGKSGQMHHGWNIELGSPTIPAHPFLRPAVLQNARVIIELLSGK